MKKDDLDKLIEKILDKKTSQTKKKPLVENLLLYGDNPRTLSLLKDLVLESRPESLEFSVWSDEIGSTACYVLSQIASEKAINILIDTVGKYRSLANAEIYQAVLKYARNISKNHLLKLFDDPKFENYRHAFINSLQQCGTQECYDRLKSLLAVNIPLEDEPRVLRGMYYINADSTVDIIKNRSYKALDLNHLKDLKITWLKLWADLSEHKSIMNNIIKVFVDKCNNEYPFLSSFKRMFLSEDFKILFCYPIKAIDSDILKEIQKFLKKALQKEEKLAKAEIESYDFYDETIEGDILTESEETKDFIRETIQCIKQAKIWEEDEEVEDNKYE